MLGLKKMISWLNKQGVKSSEGFEVQFTGRFTAEYREGLRYLVVDVEDGANGRIDFNAKQFEKWANSSTCNSQEEQERMLKNFMAALEFQGLKGMP
jgi:hypothetical protein